MRDPKRILKKLIGPDISIEPFELSGEPLEQVVETFRDVVQCRKIRDFIKIQFGIDLAISPETFYQLLEIGSINYIETTKRDLEVETISLKDTRKPDDPVSIGNLNSVLRELFKDLQLLHERIHKDFSDGAYRFWFTFLLCHFGYQPKRFVSLECGSIFKDAIFLCTVFNYREHKFEVSDFCASSSNLTEN